MLNELKTYADAARESGHGLFFAITSDEYTEWDRGSDIDEMYNDREVLHITQNGFGGIVIEINGH